jgi:hypothetical protein
MNVSLDALWPERARVAVPGPVVVTSLALGVLAAAAVDVERPGYGLSLLGAAVLVAALAATRTRPSVDQLLATVGALALLVAPALRAAEWLDVLCLLGAIGLGTLAVVGGRSWTGVVAGAVMPAVALLVVLPWVRRGVGPLGKLAPAPRGALAGGLTFGVVLVFGSLFVAADPAYGALVGDVVPDARADVVVQRVFVLGVAAVAALVAATLALHPPQVENLRPAAPRPVARVVWAGPLVALDVLFLSFVLVQLAVLFGGHRHVLTTQGLSYAEYARQGFWELLVVTVLTLGVVAAATRYAPRETPRERLLLRALLGALCVMALVVVVSAMHRMSLYEEAFGFTRLRVAVQAVEIGLGAVLVLVLVAGVRMSGAWLPRATVAVAALVLLGLTALDPDAYIARRDVDRYERTGKVDLAYLGSLSADAVPALMKLPEGLRGCAVDPILQRLQSVHDHWYDGNVSRSRARDAVPGACTRAEAPV